MVPPVEVIRSPRRRRTGQAHARHDGTIVVRVPAGMPPEQEAKLVRGLVEKVTGAQRARRAGGDAELQARADRLADRHLDGIRATSVAWSSRMAQRWASCSVESGRIRVSDRLATAPSWVIDGVLIHELAHLQEPDHGPGFHALVARHREHDRVRGFLEGLQFARSQGPES